MTDALTAPPEDALQAEITDALVAVWVRYAGKHPTAARTEIRDNIIICVLVDAVRDYDAALVASEATDADAGATRVTSAAYKSEAAATVAALTGRRVTSFISSHDPETDVATETFTLERRFYS
ncbi:MAG: Na-translocating system protein MpsC family protein [Solirubrobacterales bacterium]